MRDPIAKALTVGCLSLGLFGPTSTTYLVAVMIGYLSWTVIARVAASTLLRRLRSVIVFLSVIIGVNALNENGTIMLAIGSSFVTAEGLEKGMNQAFRLATALWGASLLVSTTRLEEVLDSAERFTARRGRPLLAAGTIALCYMPLLVERAGRIAIARRARGEDDSRGLFNRLHRLAGSALPLFAAALRDAESLAEAMQARCYEPTSPRQPFRMTSFRLREAGISACAFTLTAVSMLGVI